MRDAFAGQADAFEDNRTNSTFGAGSSWIFDRVQRSSADLVLDVAAGTGHAARQIAPSVRAVVALDVTTEMLQRGHRAALEDGHRNIVFQRGDAADLPFLDDSFDLVVCRFALHHFDDVAPVVREMRRCARPGAHVVVADLVGHDDEAVHRRQDELERLATPPTPKRSRRPSSQKRSRRAVSSTWTSNGDGPTVH